MTRALLLALALIACTNTEPAPALPRAPVPAATDMCVEHGVLEALCTKCQPALVAVFQKKGDWCAEHGFPESICPICHPERGGRPVSDVTVARGPSDGIRVRLASVEVGEVAGIRTVAVELAPAREVMTVATIHYDATRVARLNPRAEGVVRSLAVDVGSRVAIGDLLAEIDSAAIGESRARIATARARLTLAKKQASRVASLAPDGATSTRALEEARGAVREAEGEIAALVASQALVGETDGQSYRVESPIAGVVVARSASIGAYVDRDDLLFEVVDTSVMWAEIEVPEREVADVREGLAVTLTVDGVPGTFTGTISYLAPEVDVHSRTIVARVPLQNPGGVLRANQFARAALDGAEPESGALLVPRAAIQAAEDVSLVFVPIGPALYEGRHVMVGRSASDGRVQVRGRLAAGERVVTEGAFLLKTETLKDSIGAGCCADDGAK